VALEIPTGDLAISKMCISPEQKALLRCYDQAAAILRAAGFAARVEGFCVSGPRDRPAHIVLDGIAPYEDK